jgi:hypothetical protein
MKLQFWLLALDMCNALRLPQSAYYWVLRRASDATDWGSL